jgi:hypothetical protein
LLVLSDHRAATNALARWDGGGEPRSGSEIFAPVGASACQPMSMTRTASHASKAGYSRLRRGAGAQRTTAPRSSAVACSSSGVAASCWLAPVGQFAFGGDGAGLAQVQFARSTASVHRAPRSRQRPTPRPRAVNPPAAECVSLGLQFLSACAAATLAALMARNFKRALNTKGLQDAKALSHRTGVGGGQRLLNDSVDCASVGPKCRSHPFPSRRSRVTGIQPGRWPHPPSQCRQCWWWST